MTYRQLKAKLASFSEEELQQTALVHLVDSEEFSPITYVSIQNDSDVLDPGHITFDIDA